MKVFVHEYVTAEVGDDSPASASLRAEGRAMLDAAVEDFAVIAEVRTEGDFRELATWADATLVIAPESDGILEQRCRWVLEVGGTLLGPSPVAVRLTSDKHMLSQHWISHGVATPRTGEPNDLNWPQVWKPRDGAGSAGVRLIETRNTKHETRNTLAQEFAPGRAASVAFIVGADRTIALPPCWQHLSDDGRFRYLGGEYPIPPEFARRAETIARQAVACVGGLRGYVGVDVVLGERDWAIEINPRLTTSYTGLRKLARFNLAAAILAASNFCDWPAIEWHDDPVTWSVTLP